MEYAPLHSVWGERYKLSVTITILPNSDYSGRFEPPARFLRVLPQIYVFLIKDYLDKLNIPYDYYTHTLAPDSNSLKRSLQAKNVSMSNATLLKTVVLQEKCTKPSHREHCIYAILPYDKMVAYDHMNYELVPESLVIKKFNQGTISPLTVITERADDQESNRSIFLLNNDRINTEYVIMGGGSNSESIRIKTKAFRKVVAMANIIVQSIIE